MGVNPYIVVGCIILILVGTLGYVYFTKEKPAQEEYERMIIKVYISTEYNNEKIPTTLEITTLEGIKTIKTSHSYEFIEVQSNQTIKIKNINEKGQIFYEKSKEYFIQDSTTRIDFQLVKVSEMIVKSKNNENNITLTIFSNYTENPVICLKWSANYMFVKGIDLEQIEKIPGYENWGRCYQFSSLYNEEKNLTITYSKILTTLEKRYINASIIDKNYPKNTKEIQLI